MAPITGSSISMTFSVVAAPRSQPGARKLLSPALVSHQIELLANLLLNPLELKKATGLKEKSKAKN
jgi:hypothetical protein